MSSVTIRKVASGYVATKQGSALGSMSEEHAFETYASLSRWLSAQMEPLALVPKDDIKSPLTWDGRPPPLPRPQWQNCSLSELARGS